MINPAEAERIGQQGVAALHRGDASAARAAFERLASSGSGGTQARLLLAEACRRLGDVDAEASALDSLLAADPHNIAGLIMRGDAHGRAGDRRAATAFYQAALAAAKRGGQVPAALAAKLERAAALVSEAGRDYHAYLRQALSERRIDPAEAGRRFEDALDVLAGRKQVYLQQPTVFYFPGLPQIQFYERERFAWVRELEEATPQIRAELVALLNEGAEFRPYVEQEENRPFHDFHGLNANPSWSAFYLWNHGSLVEENAARCPRTVAALEKVPMTFMGARTPSVLFSLLQPGAHIPPHSGMLNTRLICHLPLIVPRGCWLRVGNEVRHWEEGRVLIFDDSIEHEALNPTGEPRIVLLFDTWRPELDDKERRGVAAIFEAIDAYGVRATA